MSDPCCNPIAEPKSDNACCNQAVSSRLADEQARAAAELLRALADPARLQILDILSQRGGEVCVCDLEGNVGLPDEQTGQRPKQPTISHHLKVLRAAGLIDCEKRGVWAYYFLRRERLAEVQALLTGLLSRVPAAGAHAGQGAQPIAATVGVS